MHTAQVTNRKSWKPPLELESYNLTAITENWRNESHDWSTAIDGCRLFRRKKWGQFPSMFRRDKEGKVRGLFSM